MARRRTSSPKFWEKYKNVYAKTADTWTTRYYTRKSDPQFNLLGLDTASDDFHKKDGSSPYLSNVRYMGEREPNQRAQVMSRKGAEFMSTLGEDVFERPSSLGKSYIEVYEGKAIEWELLHNKLLTGISIYLQNLDGTNGYVKITIRDYASRNELANAIIDCSTISKLNEYSLHTIRFINTVRSTRVRVRAEIVDDLTEDELESPRNQRRAIRIRSNDDDNHEYSLYEIPNNDEALKEIPYSWTLSPNVPLTGVMVNDWRPMPRNHPFTAQKKRWMAFPVATSGAVVLYKTDLETGDTTELSTMVDSRAQAVRFVQAEGYLYYVDGYSPLRRVNLTTWAVQDVVPLVSEITLPNVTPASLTAKAGASLIWFLNNRIYLSGFADDPNLVSQSLIDDVKPRFEQYDASGKFYSPDQSPEASAASPITALCDINNYLVIFRVDGISMYDRGGSTILEDTTQVTPEGSKLGVLNQEAVTQSKGNIYFFNPIEGVCRFGGTTYKVISDDVSNLIDRIPNKEKVFMFYFNGRLRLYCSFTEGDNDRCLYYYQQLEGRLPWYQDTKTPVSSAFGDDKTGKIYGIHSETTTTMRIDEAFKDFDSYIEMEYHTNYRVPPTSVPEGDTIIRRLYVHEIADSSHSIFIGLDIDHRDDPTVWRKFASAIDRPTDNPDAVFQHTAEDGVKPHAIHCLIRATMYQVRLKRYCYKDSAEILGISTQYGDRAPI